MTTKKLRQFLCLLAAIVFMTSLATCSSNQTDSSEPADPSEQPESSEQGAAAEYQVEHLTFEEAVLRRDVAIIGEYLDAIEHETVSYETEVAEMVGGITVCRYR